MKCLTIKFSFLPFREYPANKTPDCFLAVLQDILWKFRVQWFNGSGNRDQAVSLRAECKDGSDPNAAAQPDSILPPFRTLPTLLTTGSHSALTLLLA